MSFIIFCASRDLNQFQPFVESDLKFKFWIVMRHQVVIILFEMDLCLHLLLDLLIDTACRNCWQNIRAQVRDRVRVRSLRKSCVRVRVCFGHGFGHGLMSEVVSVSAHPWLQLWWVFLHFISSFRLRDYLRLICFLSILVGLFVQIL